MKKIFSASLLATALAFSIPAQADTNQVLPANVAAALAAAQSPADVAALVSANPQFAATIMFIAANNGVASPSQVVTLSGAGLGCAALGNLVTAAAEAAPGQADIAASAAFNASGGDVACAPTIGAAAVAGIEASGTLSAAQIDTEAAEIAAALAGLTPGDLAADQPIFQAIANATSNPTDDAGGIQTAAIAADPNLQTADSGGGIQTGTINDGGGLGGLGVGDGTSEAQENPSPT